MCIFKKPPWLNGHTLPDWFDSKPLLYSETHTLSEKKVKIVEFKFWRIVWKNINYYRKTEFFFQLSFSILPNFLISHPFSITDPDVVLFILIESKNRNSYYFSDKFQNVHLLTVVYCFVSYYVFFCSENSTLSQVNPFSR